jgi:Icc-related predicted phosphoesterase
MQILAVSDRIVDRLYSSEVVRQLPKVDLLIGCGDLPYFYLEFLVSSLNSTLVYVRGNHDRAPQYTSSGRTLLKPQGGLNLHATTHVVNGLLIAGLEGSMRYKPNTTLLYSETEMTLAVARLIPNLLQRIARYRHPLDILVTHSPPYGIHDEKDLAHRGFKIFLPLLKLFRPRLLLHGHVHVYRSDTKRISRYENTTIVNVYPYRLLNVVDDNIEVN